MTLTKDGKDLNALLAEAEIELFEWATGQRSYTNEQMNSENWIADPDPTRGIATPNRGETLVRIAERDAAELLIATRKVLALRVLCGLSPEGTYGA